MYFETVDWATSNPSISSSPWIRDAPHSRFSLLIRWMRSRRPRSILGRPALFLDFHRQNTNQIARGFIAGFASTLMFHQGILMLLYSAGLAPNMPFALQPTQPLGVPEVYSLALWGGVWGILFLWVVGHLPQGRLYWIDSVIFGAVAPSLVAWFVVMPLKG